MKKELVDKLWQSSNAITHYLFREDDLGMAELTTAGIVVSLILFFGALIGSSILLGGF